ncbi:hypothetical protein SLE2022_165980 [Rubroshorea leprosula]
MSQESLIYSLVARGTMILSECTEFTGNFPAITAQYLQRLPSSNNKFTYNCDHHTFNFLVEDGYYKFALISSLSFSFFLLEESKWSMEVDRCLDVMVLLLGKPVIAASLAFGVKNIICRPSMKEHMKYIIEHAEEIEKLLKVKAQVSEVKSIMLENIDKALERVENLTTLADKTENLRNKIKLVVLGILLTLVLIIWPSICHGFDCTN